MTSRCSREGATPTGGEPRQEPVHVAAVMRDRADTLTETNAGAGQVREHFEGPQHHGIVDLDDEGDTFDSGQEGRGSRTRRQRAPTSLGLVPDDLTADEVVHGLDPAGPSWARSASATAAATVIRCSASAASADEP